MYLKPQNMHFIFKNIITYVYAMLTNKSFMIFTTLISFVVGLTILSVRTDCCSSVSYRISTDKREKATRGIIVVIGEL